MTAAATGTEALIKAESVSRRFELVLAVNRSMTTSMVCFSCFFSFPGPPPEAVVKSVSECTTPSTRTRE